MASSLYITDLDQIIKSLEKESRQLAGPDWNRVKLKAYELLILVKAAGRAKKSEKSVR